jgi:hypothetical protein
MDITAQQHQQLTLGRHYAPHLHGWHHRVDSVEQAAGVLPSAAVVDLEFELRERLQRFLVAQSPSL